ncbi:glycosyltransferase [Lactobacillus hominis]|uniref:Putative glycosyl transferase n=1 Tax=Lactobacillus hominis DSM 23910 = CRBIP 24.179 TaxID=1423758 RepID=I7JUZ7_9LACO|nr:glycosyltransferase [Lactobacillus hominis]KRM85528.1 glycosyl transferase, group 1 [Lactobacillus hominis DSM 23910 = CRBIP 24.179]MCT3347411.1 glycosyltransferase [Lactobacillus hominis]CCI81956.1 Putative glycosyl transferase [Lactobacillus hominis DSM 23910 = CRBIP 24.179]
MKILQYTLGLPPYRRGGLPRYSTDLSIELAKTNEVYLMYPGQINPYSNKIKLVEKKDKYPFQTIEMKNPLPVSLGLGVNEEKYYMQKRNISALKKLITDIQPDIVHLHTLMGLPKEFLEYLRQQNIKTVYTTHDFYGLCPKMLNNYPKEALKTSECSYDCLLCNVGPSYKKIVIMQSHLYANLKDSKFVKSIRSQNKTSLSEKTEGSTIFSTNQIVERYKLRKYYLEMFKLIDMFHFNSSVSKQYFQKYFPDINGKIVSITHSGLKDQRKEGSSCVNDPIHLGYIGPYDEKKGFYLYTKILKNLNSNKFEAHFYGDIADRAIFKDKKYINHGILSAKDLNNEYKTLDLLVVPSLWHETFGYIVLEALLMGVPCLVSNNVGSKDLIPNSWVFKDKNDLERMLNYIIYSPAKIQQMKSMVSKLNLNYKMDEHVNNIITELYN